MLYDDDGISTEQLLWVAPSQSVSSYCNLQEVDGFPLSATSYAKQRNRQLSGSHSLGMIILFSFNLTIRDVPFHVLFPPKTSYQYYIAKCMGHRDMVEMLGSIHIHEEESKIDSATLETVK